MYYLLFGIFSGALCLLVGANDRAVVSSHPEFRERSTLRQHIVAIAEAELGVRELTGHNDGQRVEAYLAYTKLAKGHEWCAAFVCWCYGRAGSTEPRNPWSPALFPNARRYKAGSAEAQAGIDVADIFGIYGAAAKRINHVGLVKKVDGKYIISIEGNSANSVLSKRRLIHTIYAFANWLD